MLIKNSGNTLKRHPVYDGSETYSFVIVSLWSAAIVCNVSSHPSFNIFG